MYKTRFACFNPFPNIYLHRNNVGYASMCNTTGLAIGSMIGSVWFTLLTSKDFCNKYVRAKPDTEGIVTMERKSLKNLSIDRSETIADILWCTLKHSTELPLIFKFSTMGNITLPLHAEYKILNFNRHFYELNTIHLCSRLKIIWAYNEYDYNCVLDIILFILRYRYKKIKNNNNTVKNKCTRLAVVLYMYILLVFHGHIISSGTVLVGIILYAEKKYFNL